MPYQCFAAGCPANHASKWQLCTLPDDDPLVRLRFLLHTQFIAGSGLTDVQAIIVSAGVHEIERLREIKDERDRAYATLGWCTGCDSTREKCMAGWQDHKKCCPDCTHAQALRGE